MQINSQKLNDHSAFHFQTLIYDASDNIRSSLVLFSHSMTFTFVNIKIENIHENLGQTTLGPDFC